MERSIILYFESINTQQKSKTLTPLQKLQAENERRRDELDLKREDLADKKSFRQIGSVLMSPYLKAPVQGLVTNAIPNKSLDMAGKLAQGKQYLEKSVTIPQW